MNFGRRISGFLRISLILAVFFAALTRAQKVGDERAFSYDESSRIGPSHWGGIRPEWRACNSGRMQSPIDLLHQRVQIVSNLGRLDRNYKPAHATFINRGHSIMLNWTNDAGHIKINGTMFHLKQCHWHSPSEHTLDGTKFDLEIHLVHVSHDNRTAVIGIMYKIGHPDSSLSMLTRDFEALAETRQVEKYIGIIDPNFIKFGSKKYYRYTGSLTTPPCTQNIIWTIERKTEFLSEFDNLQGCCKMNNQLQTMRKRAVSGNSAAARKSCALKGKECHKLVCFLIKVAI
ncbi:alpha carbonic anhydrase 7 [Perilla frutescens var. frutescens]|nr:alpha carbonic anhydrase 7 [Perilla frutescens var. frutescens]